MAVPSLWTNWSAKQSLGGPVINDGLQRRIRDDGLVGAVQVWLDGGSATGRSQLVESDADGCLPAVVVLPQTGFHLGSSDEAEPRIDHVYRHSGYVDGMPIYRYEGVRPSA